MPEEIEVPTEHLHETLHEHAEHAKGGGEGHGEGGPPWVSQVALSAAILAVLAAVSALLASAHANEAMLEQMRATDDWAFYQAKGIKANMLQTKLEMLAALKVEGGGETKEKLGVYLKQQKEIQDKAQEEENKSREHMEHHEVLAKSVTAFQVAIAMSAIAVLAKRRALWYVNLVLGVVGVALFGRGLI
ncbi:MAG TPA: DUF4337 family protein [Minicystis sp.]|nr:DUF4337 family protein [Minicystis sp.]